MGNICQKWWVRHRKICVSHMHIIYYLRLETEKKQKELVKQGQEILRKYGIDPIAGKEVLCWAPNRVVGQHSYKAIEPLVQKLLEIDSYNVSQKIKQKQIIMWLQYYGNKASNILD